MANSLYQSESIDFEAGEDRHMRLGKVSVTGTLNETQGVAIARFSYNFVEKRPLFTVARTYQLNNSASFRGKVTSLISVCLI